MKNSSGTFGNRTRHLPACSVVPEPPASPRAPFPRHCLAKNWNAHLTKVQSRPLIVTQRRLGTVHGRRSVGITALIFNLAPGPVVTSWRVVSSLYWDSNPDSSIL